MKVDGEERRKRQGHQGIRGEHECAEKRVDGNAEDQEIWKDINQEWKRECASTNAFWASVI